MTLKSTCGKSGVHTGAGNCVGGGGGKEGGRDGGDGKDGGDGLCGTGGDGKGSEGGGGAGSGGGGAGGNNVVDSMDSTAVGSDSTDAIDEVMLLVGSGADVAPASTEIFTVTLIAVSVVFSTDAVTLGTDSRAAVSSEANEALLVEDMLDASIVVRINAITTMRDAYRRREVRTKGGALALCLLSSSCSSN